ncbi:metal-dependent hydrolase [Aquincola sp. MAHUQ-54]|uniref:Metal-dependent hydrolase n=1 Tax=Aquincola agrisoli TaxID=3119538 RepID=A0AAW9QAI6_9BURK
MDSLSQITLGAAVSVACMGRRTAVWKAALVGAVAGTLPDLDALLDHGDPVRNMTLHRTESHALFWLTLAAPVLAFGVSRLLREAGQFRRWWLAVWLTLVTHPLLDLMTVYGTQLALPFTNHPFGVGSVFIIDPAYTLPLLLGTALTLARSRSVRAGGPGLGWNAAGLAVSTAYLAWGVAVQQHVRDLAEASLAQAGLRVERLLVTPAPLSTLVWRVVAITPADDAYHEGFYALADRGRPIRFERHPRGEALRAELQDLLSVERIAWFSHGFYRLREADGRAWITDLRMGQEPYYSFDFAVARRGEGGRWEPQVPEQVWGRVPIGPGLDWLGRRLTGRDVAPPR